MAGGRLHRLLVAHPKHGATTRVAIRSTPNGQGDVAKPRNDVRGQSRSRSGLRSGSQNQQTQPRETETKRLYQFLSGLDDKYDGLPRELLKENPEPSAEDAFGIVKQEENRTGIWKSSPQTLDSGIRDSESEQEHCHHNTTGSPEDRHRHRTEDSHRRHRTEAPPPIGDQWTSQNCFARFVG